MAELSKREKVYHVFQQISQTYDRANGRISLGMESRWKDCLIEAVCEQAAKGSRVLDVCSGTGDIAISLAAHRPDLKVTGLDFSPAMLDVARKKGAPLANVTWQEGDAMNLPFEDNTFSAACISFGLRNTSDYLRVLQEMTRVVVPGGWVYCLDSFVPDSLVIRPFLFGVLPVCHALPGRRLPPSAGIHLAVAVDAGFSQEEGAPGLVWTSRID